MSGKDSKADIFNFAAKSQKSKPPPTKEILKETADILATKKDDVKAGSSKDKGVYPDLAVLQDQTDEPATDSGVKLIAPKNVPLNLEEKVDRLTKQMQAMMEQNNQMMVMIREMHGWLHTQNTFSTKYEPRKGGQGYTQIIPKIDQ